jgi:DNA anti-recombination protein RmuC
MQRDPSPPSGDRARRRSLFGGRRDPDPPSPTVGLTPSAAERAEVVITAYQQMIQEQLDEGLRAIQHTANTLMHEIAAEVWRSADGDKESVGASILQELSRDQAIRALIAHSDERFQALAARTGRLEDTMNMLAETVRTAKEQIARSADALAESGGDGTSAPGAGQIRAQLDEVSRQVAAAFQTLAERDQVILDTVRERIREHGELITQETVRISQAMQEYVQQGVEAMGRLASSADSQIGAMSAMEAQTGDRVRETVEQQVSQLGEQLQLLYDRTGIAMTSLHESVTYLGDRLGAETRDRLAEMNREFEARVLGLANLVRSDAEALRGEIVRTAAEHDEVLARTLDERLASVTDRITDTISESVRSRFEESMAEMAARSEEQTRLLDARSEEQTRLLEARAEEQTRLLEARAEEQTRLLEARAEEQTRLLEARTDEQARLIDERTGEAVSAIDRNVVRMVDQLEEHFDRLGQSVGQRAGTAAELAIGARFDDVLARMHEVASRIEDESSQTRGAIAETRGAITQTRDVMAESRAAFEQGVTALAKLMRSDSETLARQILADQDVSKQALRATKELQASLPAEVIRMVEERFGSLAESIERSNEMLAGRIDRMADTLGQKQNDDIQIVIDRMGDAMHALASLGKGETGND